MEKSRKPKIRFKGYNDDWEQREFSEMFDCTISNNTLSRSELSYEEGSILNIHYGDILIKYGSILDIHKYKIPRIPNKKKEDFKGSLLQPGDVVIADTAEDEMTGKACEIGSLFGNSIVAGLHTMVARPNIEMASGYLGYYLNSNAYHCQLLPMMQGIKVLSLSRANVKKTVLKSPESTKEQHLIANYFIQLDELITLHQRKLDKLINVKKSMLEKMFPKQGSTVPEIRFNGFTQAWEQRELGDIGQTYTGLSGKTKDDFGHGHAQFVTYMNVFSNPISNPKMNEPIEVDSKQNEVEVGDVFFTTSSETPKEVGMTSVLIEKQGKMYLNSFCFGYRLYEKYDSYYLAYMLRSNSFREKIIMLAQGISRYNISKNKVMEIDVFIPSYKEQMEIGKYFRNLDTLITLHQRKLEKLKNIKKSMLEKMFI